MSGLITDFQETVARAFFDMPESKGFLLAGGAALIALGAVERTTDDLDFFAARGEADVPEAKAAFVALCVERGWAVEHLRDNHEFVRLRVFGVEDKVEVDIGIDASLVLPPTVTFLGPTIGLEENAGRKTLALFGRYMPRDFVDVYSLVTRFGKDRLLDLAAERDLGFDLWVFAQALHEVGGIDPEEFPIASERRDEMIAFFNEWAEELRVRSQS